MANLESIFAPESVAVIGASTTPGKVGHDIFANILRGGYTGILYPVNPGAQSILSVRAYPSVLDIPDSVDLAMLILPPKFAVAAAEQAIEKGVRGLVIVSAGFREVGEEGAAIEQQIVSMCRQHQVRVVGPNCLGVINPLPAVRLNASFSARMPAPGKISFISQSGALCTAVLDFATDRDFGFSKFISIGNKADMDELDLLEYLHQDPDTEVIMIYLEELRRGPEFIQAVKKITSGYRRTPILVIKSGRTTAGAQAAASHTGALAGSEAVYNAIFEQAGMIRVDTIDELFDFASAFAYKTESAVGKTHRKIPTGSRVAIITNAGGPGIVATDMTVSSGLELAWFRPETIETLAQHLPATANIHNPVDVIGHASYDRYENSLEAVIHDPDVDGALVILTPQSMTNALATAEAIVRVAQNSDKPILCCFMGIVDVSAGVKYLQSHGYPVFKFPENAAKAFGALYRYARWLTRRHLGRFPSSTTSMGRRKSFREPWPLGAHSLVNWKETKFSGLMGFMCCRRGWPNNLRKPRPSPKTSVFRWSLKLFPPRFSTKQTLVALWWVWTASMPCVKHSIPLFAGRRSSILRLRSTVCWSRRWSLPGQRSLWAPTGTPYSAL